MNEVRGGAIRRHVHNVDARRTVPACAPQRKRDRRNDTKIESIQQTSSASRPPHNTVWYPTDAAQTENPAGGASGVLARRWEL
jgi:hypothetical protein